MLKNAQTYEIMTPESVGVKQTSLVMGKHSGRHAFREKLKELGFELGDNALEDAFRRFKDLADRKKHVFDEDIAALVEDEIAHAGERIQVLSLTVIAGTGGPQKAIVTLDVDGEHVTKQAIGNGPVDAIFKAIQAIVPHKATLAALPGARGHRRHRCAGRSLRAARRGRAVVHGRAPIPTPWSPRRRPICCGQQAHLEAQQDGLSRTADSFHRRRVIRPKNRQAGNFRPDAKYHAKRPEIKVKSRSSSPSGHEIRNSFHQDSKNHILSAFHSFSRRI